MDPLMATIMMFGGTFAPRGWAFCDGQLLPISKWTALFSLLGTTYGGDGRTTFGLPDLRGRTSIGPRQGPGLSNYRLGQRGGVEDVILNILQIPSHSHQVTAPSTGGNLLLSTDTAVRQVPQAGDVPAAAETEVSLGTPTPVKSFGPANNTVDGQSLSGGVPTLLNTGGNLSHTNMQPFLAINYIIAMIGVYPSRS